jgi:hypothetical protein
LPPPPAAPTYKEWVEAGNPLFSLQGAISAKKATPTSALVESEKKGELCALPPQQPIVEKPKIKNISYFFGQSSSSLPSSIAEETQQAAQSFVVSLAGPK